MEPQFGPAFGAWNAKTETLTLWGTGDEVWESTTYRDAAEYTAAVCLDQDAVGVLRCESSSFDGFVLQALTLCWYPLVVGNWKTFKEIADSFAEVYGIKPKVQSLGTMQQLHDKMHAVRAEAPREVFRLNCSARCGPTRLPSGVILERNVIVGRADWSERSRQPRLRAGHHMQDVSLLSTGSRLAVIELHTSLLSVAQRVSPNRGRIHQWVLQQCGMRIAANGGTTSLARRVIVP